MREGRREERVGGEETLVDQSEVWHLEVVVAEQYPVGVYDERMNEGGEKGRVPVDHGGNAGRRLVGKHDKWTGEGRKGRLPQREGERIKRE